ncbi:SipW-dependent-type signal peptide-containing protein [Phosphitispora sp. TUW77]|uniref:SipW-dependent-type signal peptide-containing protein n=1 Tax=Phosphitispora sp. TUW77 TaxID=3152361 RepID=UPI003AB7722D
MKKSRFLVLALVVAIMMMGAGYAAWTETVTINNTVETGNLSVALADGTVVVNDTLTNRTAEAVLDTSAVDDNVVNVTVTNLYPGAVATVTVPVTNDGSIPVKINPGTFAHNNTDVDYTVALTSAPADLAVGASGDIIYTITVGDDAAENDSVSFSVTAEYMQFNL